MNKEEFLNYLKNGTNDRAIMLDCCQYFVDCYPIFLLQVIQTPFGNIDTGRGIWTSLPDYKVKDDPIINKTTCHFLKLIPLLISLISWFINAPADKRI